MTFFNHFHLLRFHLLNELALLYIYGYLFISTPQMPQTFPYLIFFLADNSKNFGLIACLL